MAFWTARESNQLAPRSFVQDMAEPIPTRLVRIAAEVDRLDTADLRPGTLASHAFEAISVASRLHRVWRQNPNNLA
jgi:hypothetical protein